MTDEAPSGVVKSRGAVKGRGAVSNATGRFETDVRKPFDDGWGTQDVPAPRLRTTVGVDASRSVISYNDSPDIPFDRSVNPYRGCEHGCVYCYARPTHTWLGLSAGLDFESKLFYKPDTVAQLRRELGAKRYLARSVAPLALGANTDPYQPVERRLRVTRDIIALLSDCHHPLRITTKGALVERDIDLLAPMAAEGLAYVHVSIATLDRELARRMEPRAAAPQRRLETIRRLTAAGIPTGVIIAPVLPVLNDGEFEAVLGAARDAGAVGATYGVLRLPHELRTLFREWLAEHHPLKADHVMNRVREMRGGKDYDAAFDQRMHGTGPLAELLASRFSIATRRLGFRPEPALDGTRFVPPGDDEAQLALF